MITILNTIWTFIKAKKILIYIVVVLAVFGFGLAKGIKIYKSEMQRQENNYLASIQQLRNDNVANQRIYNLKIDEVKAGFPELKQQLRDINIKLKNVESIQNINTVTHTDVNTVLRDTTINDTILAKVATYKDKWTDFKLVNINDSIKTTIITRDSLFIVLNKVHRTLWQWLRSEPRIVKSTVKNYNPNSQITWNRFIRIEK